MSACPDVLIAIMRTSQRPAAGGMQSCMYTVCRYFMQQIVLMFYILKGWMLLHNSIDITQSDYVILYDDVCLALNVDDPSLENTQTTL